MSFELSVTAPGEWCDVRTRALSKCATAHRRSAVLPTSAHQRSAALASRDSPEINMTTHDNTTTLQRSVAASYFGACAVERPTNRILVWRPDRPVHHEPPYAVKSNPAQGRTRPGWQGHRDGQIERERQVRPAGANDNRYLCRHELPPVHCVLVCLSLPSSLSFSFSYYIR
jgi:hypothetical protein